MDEEGYSRRDFMRLAGLAASYSRQLPGCASYGQPQRTAGL